MLFNSTQFFLFLAVTVAGFFLFARAFNPRASLVWLLGASLFFYGWWNVAYLWLLFASIIFNFGVSRVLGRRKPILAFGIVCNLAVLAYFKYANFFLDSVGSPFSLEAIVLPLGISFFTFEQIAWLIETYQGKISRTSFLEYCVLIVNFPRLIAGPIIRPHELLPQLKKKEIYTFHTSNLAVGLTIFLIGLAKKVVIADSLSPFVGPVFHAAAIGTDISFLEAWAATFAYTFQLYFDFSGYTDMAIGAARMFGLVLPLNFHSPYKSLSIAEFWQRWHMSLSRFLRDYVYIPLGGSRVGNVRRYLNLLSTMTLSGLWHGAGWTFVLWGVVHGVYLVLNTMWRSCLSWFGLESLASKKWWQGFSWLLTFFFVVLAWVLFRSENTSGALTMYSSLFGGNGISLPPMLKDIVTFDSVTFDLAEQLILSPGDWVRGALWILIAAAIAFFLPNTQEFMRHEKPAYEFTTEKSRMLFSWRPSAVYALLLAILTAVTLSFFILSQQSEFLYFQF